MVQDLNERSREIFRLIVDAYLETGEPVGSRTLSQRLTKNLSPATIRSVMADLEELNLLTAPHVSAGRIPTETGLRLFVDGLLEVGALTDEERGKLEIRSRAAGKNLPQMLEELTSTLSGLSACAGLVVVPKPEERALKQIEFVSLAPHQALVVLVSEGGLVENRVVELPPGVPASALTLAGNFLNAHLSGKSLSGARHAVQDEIKHKRHELDEITARLVDTGLAIWSGEQGGGYLIVRGQSQLLNDVQAVADLDRVRNLFEALETRETMLRLLDATSSAEGVQIFIGAENRLFAGSGCSMIVSPYMNGKEKVVGAIGVVGPVRMNYAKIIPMVDYTARLIGKMVN